MEATEVEHDEMRAAESDFEGGRALMNAGSHRNPNKVHWLRTLSLAFQCLGIVYGDIGTSPLYVFTPALGSTIANTDDIVGVLSLIIYTIILLPFIKYMFIVLYANDNGDGGTFALYSLICRHMDVSLIPNRRPKLRETATHGPATARQKRADRIVEMMEGSRVAKGVLFLVTIVGTSMVIGDGILNPSISVLSALNGITGLSSKAQMWISVGILVVLFGVQRFGTEKVGFSFAPITLVWFILITGIGLFNMFEHGFGVLRAFNPWCIVEYFERNGKRGFISLGGTFLSITGVEAMFADLGHFSVRSIQISFVFIVLPSSLIAYCGQAAYLMKYPQDIGNAFYASIPGPLYWPSFVVAIAASVVTSQAMITGSFAIISQSQSLGCFPRVKVVHTSSKYEGQVYIPLINYAFMIICILTTIYFGSSSNVANAYGVAVIGVMVITTCLLTVVMLVVWKTNIWLIFLFVATLGSVEFFYLAANLYKFVHGGYLPLGLAFVLVVTMVIWHYGYRARHIYELDHQASPALVQDLVHNAEMSRASGMALLYTEVEQGIPPIFSHFVKNVPLIHSVMVVVSIKILPISRVALNKRFTFWRIEPRELMMFGCEVRYGYDDDRLKDHNKFEQQLIENLKAYIGSRQLTNEAEVGRVDARVNALAAEEMQYVQMAIEKGVVYMLGEAEVVAKPSSSFIKKLVVNHAYGFLRRNFRSGSEIMVAPTAKLVRVGMTYEI
ncbi:hypothetical protein MLD38_004273 [Melastoma candidum]|uniref:Uncharacterized protein n=1 Tax=Melastoma candidum TaxID=119954 RepID=A0ACB9SDR5_9MYRT|nr:hypothetical protein MLD38_004273 [Melastoma candidum]